MEFPISDYNYFSLHTNSTIVSAPAAVLIWLCLEEAKSVHTSIHICCRRRRLRCRRRNGFFFSFCIHIYVYLFYFLFSILSFHKIEPYGRRKSYTEQCSRWAILDDKSSGKRYRFWQMWIERIDPSLNTDRLRYQLSNEKFYRQILQHKLDAIGRTRVW